MKTYIPSKEELEEIIKKAVRNTIEETLPGAIRKATRKKWLNTEEVMKMLQCSRRQVQYLRDSKQLSFSQNGRTIRYDIDEVERFLNRGKVSRHQP